MWLSVVLLPSFFLLPAFVVLVIEATCAFSH